MASVIEILFCGILTGLKKKNKPEDKRRLLDNEKIDSPWARKS